MQKITPNLWFDGNAEAAVDRYTTIFEDATIGDSTRYDAASAAASGQPEGSVMTVEFELEGQSFVALNGGPQFPFTPAISFVVNCPTTDEVDELWAELSEGGAELMPLDSYPFSDRYGWTNDEFGVSWQLIHADSIPERTIAPSLMFVGERCGQAEDAIEYYTSVFDFNESISFIVDCADQAEVDYYWDELTADGGEKGQCGWLTDRYGVSWQIVPTILTELLQDEDAEKAGRVTEAMLQMEKIDISTLEDAYAG